MDDPRLNATTLNARTSITAPRFAMNDEVHQLKAYRMECGEDEETARFVVQEASLAVFPHYQTGSLGYCGKVMVVLYDSGPEYVESYIWTRGQMVRVNPEEIEEEAK
jgi:hypothetical protein